MKTDYIIVGLGLAGIAVAEEVRRRGKTCVVFENESQTSSLVAGGMYNPVVLKRFNPVWRGAEQLEAAMPFYQKLEERFEKHYDQPMDILRIFKSVEEQNNWFSACDKPRLRPFLDPEIVQNNNSAIRADHLMGRVWKTGRVVVRELVNDYRKFLEEEGRLLRETFHHDELEVVGDEVRYGSHKAGRVIFCEGIGMLSNPYFNSLPLEGTKGELITIHAPDLRLKEVIKSAVFVMPLGGDLYKIGATFNWKDKTNLTTVEGREELEEKLRTVISCDFEIRDQEAGVRPTTQDRRPLLGVHEKHPCLVLFNGLGTRGVMSAPWMAVQLLDFLEDGSALDPEIDISRFRTATR